ncbi:hypothetical protein DL98DRAFT_158640 [Cadophora sp. DSE1049]|nr:hypothetical protein DL98DRAFT_158640 [Cadophora sp. DSE1049]
MPWVWDYFSHYRMTSTIINDFLVSKFGNYDFRVTFMTDDYAFWVPRPLAEDEKQELLGLRLPSPTQY